MGKKVRSAMGTMVDFDALKIKQQLASTPSTTEVKARIESVEGRNNRRAARRAAQAAKRASNELENNLLDVDDQDEDVLSSIEDAPLEGDDNNTPTESPVRKQQTRKQP